MGDEEYDSFSKFERVKMQPFTFEPSRFEIWRDGDKVSHGSTSCIVEASESKTEVGNEIKVSLKNLDKKRDKELLKEISTENYFDDFITAGDRLQLIKVPSDGRGDDQMGLSMLKMTVGATRDYFEFGRKDPYCVNLFLIENVIEKITFSFSNPEMLIELYKNEGEKKADSSSSYEMLKQEAERIEELKNS